MLEYGVDETNSIVDIREIFNYSRALSEGENLIKRFPIYSRVIKELHRILLEGDVRGNSRNPVEFRAIQNFIGPPGCTIQTALFIPTEPQIVPEYMSKRELKIYLGVPAVLTKVKILDMEEIIKVIIRDYLDGSNKVYEDIKKFGNVDALWSLFEKYYGFRYKRF